MKTSDNQRRFGASFKPMGAVEIVSPAIFAGRSIFRKTVIDPKNSPRLLISGHNNRKIGKVVTVGRWKGMPIFTLTLEERATCPKDCHHWNSCYGNNMHLTRRHIHGKDLEDRLEKELAYLSTEFQEGFVVRLHVLGDFYSVEYVDKWRKWLEKFDGLRIFGFTARKQTTPIGSALALLAKERWDRFSIRTSLPGTAPILRTAITFSPNEKVPNGAFLCPAQRRDDKCCANCGACWQSDRTVAFMQHGRKGRKARVLANKESRGTDHAIAPGSVVSINGLRLSIASVDTNVFLDGNKTAARIIIEGAIE